MALAYSDPKYTRPWWEIPKAKGANSSLAQAVCAAFQYLDREQSHHRRRNLTHLRAYSNRMAATMSGGAFANYNPWRDDHLRLNVAQACVDAATAQAAQNPVRPMPLTVGGDYSTQRRAKGLQDWFDGMNHHLGQELLAQRVFSDAAIFGTGVQKTYAGYGRVNAKRVLIDNIVVDDIEAQLSEPRHLFEYDEKSRAVLVAEHPELEKQLSKSKALRHDHWGRYRISEPVGLVEAWKLPTYPGAGDGRHVIATETCVLLDEEWERDRLPYSVFRWKEAPLGWYGLGAIEEVMPLQIEINYLLEKKQRILWLAQSQIWVEKGSVAQSDLNNDEGTIRQYSGNPPVHMPINTGVGELDAQIENLYTKSFEILGISQLQAIAQKPAGLDSGEAQRVYNQNVSARFTHTMKRFERFHVDAAWRLVDAERDLRNDEDYEAAPVYARTKGGLKAVDFDAVIVDDEKLQLRVFPTSLLPSEPAGKLQTIKEMAEISPEMQEQLISQLDFPDTEKALSSINAPQDLADMLIEELYDGDYRAPEPTWPLQHILKQVSSALLRAQMQGVPGNVEQNFRDFLQAIQDLLNPPPAGPMPMPGAPGPGMPPGAPGPMPPGGPGPMMPPGMPEAAPSPVGAMPTMAPAPAGLIGA